MSRSYIGLVAAIAVTIGHAAPAQADRSDCKPKLERSYRVSYHKVADVHGKRAPGRNIRKNGVLFRKVVFDATCGELARSTRQLKRLLTRPAYPLTRTAIPPAQPPAGVQSPGVGAGGILLAIRICESGNDYTKNTGNGFYGAYQFTVSTFHAYGGSGMPHLASPAEQDRAAAALYRVHGVGTSASWPNCP